MIGSSHPSLTNGPATSSIESVTLEVPDPMAAERFYTDAFGLGAGVGLRTSVAPTIGFRGFTLSLVVSRPATVNSLIGAALAAGATPLKPAAQSLWGYGGVVQAPDGTIWKVATSKKKNTDPATRQIEEIVLLLGAADVAASKRFYLDRGLMVTRSFARTYVEFATPSSHVKLALSQAPCPGQGRGRFPGGHRIASADMTPTRYGDFYEPTDRHAEVHYEEHRDRQGVQRIHGRGTSRDEGARPRTEGGAPRPAR